MLLDHKLRAPVHILRVTKTHSTLLNEPLIFANVNAQKASVALAIWSLYRMSKALLNDRLNTSPNTTVVSDHHKQMHPMMEEEKQGHNRRSFYISKQKKNIEATIEKPKH